MSADPVSLVTDRDNDVELDALFMLVEESGKY